MDIAEIRKKARQQEGQNAAGPLAEPQLPTELDASQQVGQEEFVLPAVQANPSPGLERYFPGIELASEEDYIQGLSGTENHSEIETVRWLTFFLGKEEYALSLDVVLELIKPRPYTDLPKVPEYVRGILSLRGEVVPVIDLRQRLKLGCAEGDGLQRIIVCEGQEQSVGLLVDRITQVVRMPKDAIEAAPLVLANDEQDYVAGVGRFQGRLLILLNPNEVLTI